MGPAPRSHHGVVFDSGRSRVVLFGGGTITADPGKPPIVSLGDTWEHREDQPPPAGPIGVTALSLAPDQGPVNIPVTATINLSTPTQAPLTVHMHILGASGVTVDLPDVLVPAGKDTVQTQFLTPTLEGAAFHVFAGTDGTPTVQVIFMLAP